MIKRKQLLNLAPEIYLVTATIYYWSLTAQVFNPFAIGLLLILVFQLVYKKSISGLFISGLFIAINLYLVLALISELSEFSTHNTDWRNMLIVGSSFLTINITAGVFMFKKYIKKEIK